MKKGLQFWRFYVITALFFLLGAAILFRLGYLQVKNRDYYRALSEGQQKFLEESLGERGNLFFANGEPLTLNLSSRYLFICPKEIKEKEETADFLAQTLSLDRDFVLEKAGKSNLFEVLKRRLTEDEEKIVRERGLNGVYFQEELYRFYPSGETTAHITGFLSADNKGQYGIEGFYDEALRGRNALVEKERGPFGFLTASAGQSGGKDLVLTINPSIQFASQKILKSFEKELKYESAQIIVMRPDSGEIIAMAQFPSFDPNHYNRVEDVSLFQNASIQKIFEPGSVFKPIVMAAALNEGKISPNTVYKDNGFVQIGADTVHNYNKRVFGEQNMIEVLEKSINTGAVFVERQLGHKTFLSYLEKFGLFSKTGIDLQGEVFSQNLELKKGYEINFATAAFGQGVEATPIQITAAFAALINGGKAVVPHILKGETNFQGKEVISSQASRTITEMLVSVVENGFSKSARIEGYYIGGKTGTAQVSWPALGISRSGYSDKTVQTFIGFAPAYDPEFIIMIKLDNPQTKTAEYSAVPIFRALAKEIIDYWQIPPDYENGL